MLFYLISVVNFFVAMAVFYFTIKLIFKATSPLGGFESILFALLGFLAIYFLISTALEADQSHKYLEYLKVINVKADMNRIIQNPYDFYSIPRVLGITFGAVGTVFAYVFYSHTKEQRRYKRAKLMSDKRYINSGN